METNAGIEMIYLVETDKLSDIRKFSTLEQVYPDVCKYFNLKLRGGIIA